MLAVHSPDSGSPQPFRPSWWVNRTAGQPARMASCAFGSSDSAAEYRMLARKIAVRDALGYGSRPEGKRCVLALAWGISERRVAELLSLTSDVPITLDRLATLPEPTRTMVANAEREIDAISLATLRAFVDARRAVVRGRRAA